MLVLTRREDEQIVVGDSILITVMGIAGGRVRLGIDAPESVRVMRSELMAIPDDTVDRETAASSDILQ